MLLLALMNVHKWPFTCIFFILYIHKYLLPYLYTYVFIYANSNHSVAVSLYGTRYSVLVSLQINVQRYVASKSSILLHSLFYCLPCEIFFFIFLLPITAPPPTATRAFESSA